MPIRDISRRDAVPRRGDDENTNVVSPSCRDESGVPSPHPPATSVIRTTTEARPIVLPSLRGTSSTAGVACERACASRGWRTRHRLGRARSINAVPVNVGHVILAERGSPDLVTAREGNSQTRTPGVEGTATVPNLYRALERSIRIVYLPHIDAVLTQFSKQPERPVRSSHHLPDRGVVFRNPERPANRTAPTLKRRFTYQSAGRHAQPGPGPAGPGTLTDESTVREHSARGRLLGTTRPRSRRSRYAYR